MLSEKVEDLSDDARRFFRAARNWTKLDHPLIVGLLDYGIADGHPFTVEKFTGGSTLREFIGGQKMKLEKALAYSILRLLSATREDWSYQEDLLLFCLVFHSHQTWSLTHMTDGT